ncbi:Adenosine (5')-pentaphospho-(5'')-adenosine pyrophosphohydrolase [hydrothermal vent metagenome]|uniref:Adenosine (5')-pentaphospho-(5'')-adenosine pyrophosphohydrolase n=1 Tax=hydrothermal vent metagenome TaxID=652676 RepID=A0A1W1EHF2_9ZZZZ
MQNKKNYRPNVAAVILSSKYPESCEFFLAHRSDMNGIWQFPQGGIDEGETPQEALFRELKEEIGTSDVEIIGEYPEWLSYDFTKGSSHKLYSYDGQIQKYFLVRLRDNSSINLNSFITPEFSEYQFLEYDMLMKRVSYLKKSVYKKVIDYFKNEGLI